MLEEPDPPSLYRRLRPVRIVVILLLPLGFAVFDQVNRYFRTKAENRTEIDSLIRRMRDSPKPVPDTPDLRTLADRARSGGAVSVWGTATVALGQKSQLLLIEVPQDAVTRKRLFELQATMPCLGRPELDQGQRYLCLRERNLP